MAVGSVIAERYRVLATVGQGNMGTVYAVEHLQLKKKMAVKILHQDLIAVKNLAIRFEREATATAKIDHPNVATAVDFGSLPDGSMYLALEFLEGRSLRVEISQGPLSVVRALRIARQIASLLAATQPLGIVHRDLKPENIMLVHRGEERDFVKVLDFGIARLMDPPGEDAGQAAALTQLGAVFGTPEYMAPEQALGQRVDVRADLYSLGVILFEMIAGVRPYTLAAGQSGILAQQITAPRPSFAEVAKGIEVPAEVELVVGRLLAKGANERYQRASDVVPVLEHLIGELDTSDTKASPLPPKHEVLPAFDLGTNIPGVDSVNTGAMGGAGTDADSDERRGAPARELDEAVVVRPDLASPAVVATASPTWQVRVAQFAQSCRLRLQKLLGSRWGGRLTRVPPLALAMFGAGLSVGLLLAIIVWTVSARRRTDTEQSTSTGPSSVPVSSVSADGGQSAPAASAGGSPGPSDNAKDPEVLLGLMQERLVEGRDAEAVAVVAKVLARHADRRSDGRIADALYRIANSSAKDASDTAFALLEGMMAQPGADIIYQLSLDKAVRESTRRRAEKWLRSGQFAKSASNATAITVRLRFADSCEKKHALLPLVAAGGGAFALGYLRELSAEDGCGIGGKSDCYPCLRKDGKLRDAIAQIESRTTK